MYKYGRFQRKPYLKQSIKKPRNKTQRVAHRAKKCLRFWFERGISKVIMIPAMIFTNTIKKLAVIQSHLILAAALPALAGTWHVDSNSRSGNPTGETWARAFSDLQTAIDAAAEAGGGQLWIKSGVYKPAGDDRTATFRLQPGVELYGGFRGNESVLSKRNIKANRTILSGDIGRIGNSSDNCLHIVTGASDCRIDGFIISRGTADGQDTDGLGGGMLLLPGTKNMVLANCTLEKCNSTYGGALHINNAEILITNTTFYSNSAKSGGALTTEGQAKLQITDSFFNSNFAPDSGGAILLSSGTDAGILRTTFLYNATDADGGALMTLISDSKNTVLDLTQCTFDKNTANGDGGALFFDGAFSPLLAECNFRRNTSTKGAGAVAAANGAIIRTSKCNFTDNRGNMGVNDFAVDDDSDVFDVEGNEEMLARDWKPDDIRMATTETVEPEPEEPEVQQELADVFVHDENNTKVKLRGLVASADHTVLALGDLTDPGFIESYRNIEAAASDYASKGVNFYYIYRHLAHPENNGYLQPYTQRERARQTQLARELLSTQVPWLYDCMDNQSAEALAFETKNNLFVFNKEGTACFAGLVSDETGLRKTLDELAGSNASTNTPPGNFPTPQIEPVKAIEARLVKRIGREQNAAPYQTLQLSPMESRHPHYVKVRMEASEELIETGDGKLYMGFHIDPLYPVEWNNLEEPMEYALKVPTGVVAPSINTAPRVTAETSDTEPREFLLNARKLDPAKPIALQVKYVVRSKTSNRNIEVQQKYLAYLSPDPFAGKVLGRQTKRSENTEQKRKVRITGFSGLLQRFDLDRDGKISRNEAAGALLSRFDEFDTNKNGQIEESEYIGRGGRK